MSSALGAATCLEEGHLASEVSGIHVHWDVLDVVHPLRSGAARTVLTEEDCSHPQLTSERWLQGLAGHSRAEVPIVVGSLEVSVINLQVTDRVGVRVVCIPHCSEDEVAPRILNVKVR